MQMPKIYVIIDSTKFFKLSVCACFSLVIVASFLMNCSPFLRYTHKLTHPFPSFSSQRTGESADHVKGETVSDAKEKWRYES